MGSIPRGISASRGAAVLGLSEFQTPLDVFQRIMEERNPGWNIAHGYTLPPEPDNAAIRFGQAFEGAVIKLAEIAQNKKIEGRELFYSVNAYPGDPVFERRQGKELANYITCHIDGRYTSSGILHEGKTTSIMAYREKWGAPGTDRIPQTYQVQAQHQMLCTGAKEEILSVLVFPKTPDEWEKDGWTAQPEGTLRNGDNEKSALLRYWNCSDWALSLCAMGYFHQYNISANQEAQRRMVEVYREFWHKNILEEIPPEPRNYEDIKRLMPEPKSTIIVPDYIESKIAEYKGITEETSNAKKRKDRLKTIITKYVITHGSEGIEDDESREAVIFRNGSGEKLASWYKDKNGKLIFRS